MVLGRLASEIATVLMGKHRPGYAPHLDTGDNVIVVNASKLVMTARKADNTFAYRHSGYPGGLRKESYADLLEKRPEELLKITVRGMLPKTSLGRQMLKKLHVYASDSHPHQAQTPIKLELPSAKRAS